MYPMALSESRESTGEVSLSKLFDAPADIEGMAMGDVETVAQQICRGGWPEAVASGAGVASSIPRDYLMAVSEEDISAVDGVRRSPRDAMLIMRAFARCVGTMSDLKRVRLSITQRKDELSRTTFSEYVGALRRLYVFDDLEAWRPSLRARSRVSATPTRHFVDPSLAVAALGATPDMLLSDMPTLGLLFESLCVRDLRAYLSAMDGELYHYHDMTGLEADAVAVAPDGRWGAFEVKTSPRAVDDGATSLLKLASKVDESVGRMAFLAVITASGYAYRRGDGVYVIPISCLAP
jgi:predicted AAA+ superfamily ATPase